ncbi:hypothetical protein [Aurantiacibacter rhizosphaerae]|uniref:UDP-glucose/GDP-mannose dehydrogenase dimerisation domain-containing protein n=1 Tax=Aurantiacibacter rhizosphaerae TaxID=2691582 RepID=A0A844XAV9_9SPHN|nr:hypothetical protein [Aurantiacibacter rhizosphaerae]MWV26970.1 hypothetical protein [Aurantiacibacter rhizosphaerae]
MKVTGGITVPVESSATAKVVRITENKITENKITENKITENNFRAVNTALVNELKVIFSNMGISIWEVIDTAKTKPFGFLTFDPRPGLGGHCIRIDPFYLTWKAKEHGFATRFIELAGPRQRGPSAVQASPARAQVWRVSTTGFVDVAKLRLAVKPVGQSEFDNDNLGTHISVNY